MTTMLVNIAELSSIFSVILVLLCFGAMILIILRNMVVLRMHGEDIVFHSSLNQVPPRIPQMKMMKVHIPFTFKLLETSKSTYSEIQYSVSSQVRYRVQVYWGVNIKELHICLWRPWSVLRETCLSGTLLQNFYQQPGINVQQTSHSDEIRKLSLPAPLDLGTPPRLCYPLVIFLLRVEEGDIHPDETVALINVVHIKDSVCTLPTSILAQYLKQGNGQLSCLKQLYLATGNPVGYEEDGTHMPFTLAEPIDDAPEAIERPIVCPPTEEAVWNSSGEQLCVVCQYFPLSRALIPCRHTCICASCFDKLDRCPMCRGPINSYFCIRGEEYMPIQSSKSQPEHGPIFNWLDSLNDRLIDFLGFQR